MRDQHRVQTTLTAMEMMGYDAFFPFDAESEILQNGEVDLPLALLDADLRTTSSSDSDSYL